MFINSAKLSTTEYVTLSLLIAAKCAFAQAIFAFHAAQFGSITVALRFGDEVDLYESECALLLKVVQAFLG